MRKQMKNQTKTPAAAKRTAKQTPAATVARAIIQAVDEAETRAVLAGGPQPFALAPVPADFAAAVRPLLVAARLPAGALDPQVGRFAALVEEWDRVFDKTPLPCDPAAAWRELGRRELGRDWNAYRRAELARISARLAAKALRELRRLSPEAARAAAEAARPRFADAGAAVLEYLAAPLPGVDADEDTASPRVFVALLDDALDALAECAQNPPPVAVERATPAASPSNAADADKRADAAKRKGKPLGKRCEVSWKTAAGELGLSERTLQRYAANPRSVPDSLRGFCREALRTRTAFDTWRAGLGAHEGAKTRMKEAADRLGGNYCGMRVGRRP